MVVHDMHGVPHIGLQSRPYTVEMELVDTLFINHLQTDTGDRLGAKNPLCIPSDCDLQCCPNAWENL